MEENVKKAKKFVSENSKKYFFSQAFNFGGFKRFNAEYEEQLNIYNEYRIEQGEKLKNIIIFKFLKKDFTQQGAHYIFNINGNTHRYSSVELLDYGITQKTHLIKEQLANNQTSSIFCEVERDYIEATLPSSKKDEINIKKRRL